MNIRDILSQEELDALLKRVDEYQQEETTDAEIGAGIASVTNNLKAYDSVTLTIELARTKISIDKLLQLSTGSILDLEPVAGDPINVLIDGTLMAHGKIIMVNNKVGVQLTKIIRMVKSS